MAAIISVHAQFPKNIMPNTELDLNPTNWEWKETLAFPISKLNDLQFSSKPYKWIRYAIGVVVGAQGELCTERDSPNPVHIDYECSISAVSIDLYYHTTNQEKHHMFPISPKLANTRTVTSSQTNMHQDDFYNNVENRDGSCVVTGAHAMTCDAAHLIPHSKYIETFFAHRHQDSSGDNNLVQDIDDIRNGLLLGAGLHRVLGSHLAFLKTPNFAMDTTDVDSNADEAQERYTTHFFHHSLEQDYPGRSGSAAHTSNTSTWPPAALFDAVYASAVLHYFGSPMMDVLEKWEDVFYPANANKENSSMPEATQQQDGYGRYGNHNAIDPFDLLIAYQFRAMEPEKVRIYLKASEEMVVARERKELEEKVNSWRESAANGDIHMNTVI